MAQEKTYAIAYDIGSTSNKTCLYEIDGGIKLISEASEKYPLYFVPNGGVEQDPEDWWESMKTATPKVIASAGIDPKQVKAISFCSQMQGLVLIGEDGNVLRPAMSYMDKRSTGEFEDWCSGLFSIANMNARRTLISLMETGVTAGSAKDPVFRYKWVKHNEPELFSRVHKWLDVKDYLAFRATGKKDPKASKDSAFASMLYNNKNGKWSKKVCKLHQVDMSHLPEVVECTDIIGKLSHGAAKELGLHEECLVFSGGGDSTLIGIGAGSTNVGDTHIYIGTSGWVSTIVDKPMVDIRSMIASVVGAQPGRYNYFAEMETSGKCIEWVRDHIVKDSIEAYSDVTLDESTVLDHMTECASNAPAGSGGVIFMPWLLGNRCPFEDADCRGGFFNLSLMTTKEEIIRAVLEGILFHKKWMLEAQENKTPTSATLRVAGGGAKSDLICQVLSDMTGRKVERTVKPQNAGALGAAILMACGLGYIESLDEAKNIVEIDRSFTPDLSGKDIYEKTFIVFKRLHRKNKKNFRLLNKDFR